MEFCRHAARRRELRRSLSHGAQSRQMSLTCLMAAIRAARLPRLGRCGESSTGAE